MQYNSETPEEHWIDLRLPPRIRPYARLMRLDNLIGAWLLLLPCWWAIALAGGTIPNIGLMILFALGAVVMRGAGCVINDIVDRGIDRQVERTQSRPIASGEIPLSKAVGFLALLLAVAFLILLVFNKLTIGLGIASMVLVVLYPFAKRLTWWPQLVLGLAFNWGALMGWTAEKGSFGYPAFLLYVAGIFWTLGYDTIYAHQDKHDDARIGIKSLALKLGDKSPFWVGMFYIASLALLTLTAFASGLGKGFYVGLVVAMGYAAWLVLGWNPDNPWSCQKRFKANREWGLIVLAAIFLGKLF